MTKEKKQNLSRRILVVDRRNLLRNELAMKLNHPAEIGPNQAHDSDMCIAKPDSTLAIEYVSNVRDAQNEVSHAISREQRFSIVFVDALEPMDTGAIQAVNELWTADPNLQIVFCTYSSSYDWTAQSERLQETAHWQILRMPCAPVEVQQLASSLFTKWELATRNIYETDKLRKEAEASARRFASFCDAVDASQIVAMTDVRGNILEVNDNFCRVSGYSRDELVGKNHRIVKSEEHPVEFFKNMYSTVARGNVWRGEVCNRAKDGSLYWVDTTITPVFNERGKPGAYLALRVEITERKQLEATLKRLAFNDALTGLANRDAIIQSIQDAIDRKDKSNFAILFLDFDRFKLINDSLGHDFGDELLRQIASRLRETLRPTDKIQPARIGGDEFVVLLDGLSKPTDATQIAERLLNVFSKGYSLGVHTAYSTASIGVVTNQNAYKTADEMLRDADMAMYQAKSMGGSRLVVFDHAMRVERQQRHQTEIELRNAITNDEFALYYQPIVSLVSGQIQGVEALIRWNHPSKGLLEPECFLDVAQETGLIIPMSKWVFNQAFCQFATWQRTLGKNAPASIHINVALQQLLLPNVVEYVDQAIKEFELSPECVHLELTENLIMDNRSNAIETMRKLKQLGVKVDMDDFGTGFMSLSCLQELPIDMLKIDHNFILALDKVPEFTPLLRSVTSLAESLNISIIAEGIETAQQLKILRSLGCQFGQGFLFSRPVPAADFGTYISTLSNSRLNLSGILPMPVPLPITNSPIH